MSLSDMPDNTLKFAFQKKVIGVEKIKVKNRDVSKHLIMVNGF